MKRWALLLLALAYVAAFLLAVAWPLIRRSPAPTPLPPAPTTTIRTTTVPPPD